MAAAVAVVCVVAAPIRGDPMAPIEAAGWAVLSMWIGIGVRQIIRGLRLARELDRRSAPDDPTSVPCRVVLGGGRQAFVLGAVTPHIYLGDELLESLDSDELRAVLLHEEHHRRTRAPLRAVGLGAWLTLFGRAAAIRRLLLSRFDSLEEEADAYALRRGASPAALAGALLKADPGATVGVSFAAASVQRLESLVAVADGAEPRKIRSLPYEWLPVAVLAMVALACHLRGMSPFA